MSREELIEAAAKAIVERLPIDPDDGTVVIEYQPGGYPLWGRPDVLADQLAGAAYDAMEPLIRQAVAEEAVAAIYTLPYLAELPTPDLENEVKVVSRPDVVRLIREIGAKP